MSDSYYDDEYYSDDDDYYSGNNNLQNVIPPENILNQNLQGNPNYLEALLLIPQIIDSSNDNQEKDKKKFTLFDYQEEILNIQKEELFYYFSSQESLLHFKNSLDKEIKYDFYKNLDCQNFLIIQEERFKLILSVCKENSETQMKKMKLSNFNRNFCFITSLIKDKSQYQKSIIRANIIGKKMDDYSYLFSSEDVDENEIIKYLNELKDILSANIINMESLGLVHFNSIEKNLIFILKLIENKLHIKNGSKSITTFGQICIEIFKIFQSTKLFFYIIKFLSGYKEILDFEQLNNYKDLIQFIPSNCFDFKKLDYNIKNILISDLRKPLIDQGIIYKNIDEIKLNLKDYKTLYYDDYLLLLVGYQNNQKQKSKENIFYFYKFDLQSKNIIELVEINLLKKDEDNANKTIIDINFSLKKGFIFIFYIIYNSCSFSLRYKLYNKYLISLEKEGDIQLKKSFAPIKLFNDNKYFYCISDKNEILVIKRNLKLEVQDYIICSFRFFENDFLNYTDINDLFNYEMYNSLCINNIFILSNTINKKTFIAKLIINKKENSIFNLYDLGKLSENNRSIKIAYNDSRFIITRVAEGEFSLFYDLTSNDLNHLMGNGLYLLPFNSNIYTNNYPFNIYEYLIGEYSSFLNLCGNLELINSEKEKSLIEYPFSLCCNFDQNILYFIIDYIIENYNIDNIKLNYIIILKQILCCLYNTELLNEDSVIKIIPYFKKLILNLINSKEKKLLNKILSETIIIISYIKNNTIFEFNEIKFSLDKDYKNISFKSKLLLIDLILKQNKIKEEKELYEYIIQLEKNYLMSILNTESFDLSNYCKIKKIMFNASESLFKRGKKNKDELTSLILCLLENVQILFDLYKIIVNKRKNVLSKYSFIYNSFIFRALYLIIEFLLANKIILINKEILISLYKLILSIDKKNINYNECFDMNNIIEITNYSLSNNEDRYNNNHDNNEKIIIKMKTFKNIIIRTNVLYKKDYNELIDSIKIYIKSNFDIKEIKFFQEKDYIYYDVIEITVEFQTRNRYNNQNDFIINIIPLKNEKLFKFYKDDKDYEIISLIQKAMIQYLIFLFEDIKLQIENYNENPITKKHGKIFQTEIFKFISIPKNNIIKTQSNSNFQFNNITNQLLEHLNKTLYSSENLGVLNDDIIKNFIRINNEIYQNKNEFEKTFEDKIIKISSVVEQNINLFNNINYDKLFIIFNYHLSKNDSIANQINKNENLNLLIKKIFLFAIKYYNCFKDLISLKKKIEKMKIENLDDIENNINKFKLLDNYPLFYSFYEESSKITTIYHKHKMKFTDSNFNDENKKYFEINFEKIDFLYDNIIPCDDFTIKPNSLIIKNLIDLIDNSDIGIYEIIQNSQIQNINCNIKLIELTIINNLLLNINNENNIILLLYFINKKMRHNNSLLNSIFDSIYGADFFNIEKLKQQFHLFLNILSYKITNNENQFSLITKISLTESLIWKIKKKNFSILFEVMKVFEEMKNIKPNNCEDDLFDPSLNCVYNVNYYCKEYHDKCLFEVWKILIYQIIKIIKEILKYNYEKEKENKLNLERNPSTVSERDFKKILEKIITYFIDINQQCLYYDFMMLFFYQILINSEFLLKYILQLHPNVITKIIEIIFVKNNNIKSITKSLMTKLLSQIIENIEEEYDLNELIKIIQNHEKGDLIVSNPLIYFYEKLIQELNVFNEIYDYIGFNNYMNLLLVLLEKIFQLKKDDKDLQSLLNNKNFFDLFLLDYNLSLMIDNRFIIKDPEINNYQNIILFNSGKNNSIKKGKIICIFTKIQNNLENENNPLLINSFNQNIRVALIIFKDFERLDYFDVTNLEILNISNMEIFKRESKYKKLFFQKNSELIISKIKDLIHKETLNEKGIYLLFNLLKEIIKYMKKKDLIFIFEYLWKFYNNNILPEKDSTFISLEYLEKEIIRVFPLSFKNIYKLKEDMKESLYSLFNILIINNTLEINRNLEFIQKNYKRELQIPINNNDINNVEKIYNEIRQITNLSFYITSDDIVIFKKINENSVLFAKSIKSEKELTDISNIIKENPNKIKVLIVNEINNDKSNINNLINFITNNEIPIYQLENSEFNKFIEFFIKGNAGKFINLYEGSEEFLKDDICNIFNIIKFGNGDNSEIKENNEIENLIKTLPKDKLNKIKNNPLYKTRLCRNYNNYGLCEYDNQCNFAHGSDELEKIKKIKEYIFSKEKNKIVDKYELNRDKLFKDLINESKYLFKKINIKLNQRLIFKILFKDCIKLSDFENIIGNIKNIVHIYDALILEYYFNIGNKIPNELLKRKLQNYFNKLTKENIESENKWIEYHFEQMERKNFKQQINLTDFLKDITHFYSEKILLEKSCLCPDILYDKMLFMLDIIQQNKIKRNYMKYYFNIFNNVSDNLINIFKDLNSHEDNFQDNIEFLLLSNVMKIIYNYYCDTLAFKENNFDDKVKNPEIHKKFDTVLEDIMKINLDDYFNDNSRRLLKKQTASIIEFTFKYFDFCLILFYKKQLSRFFNLMTNPKNHLFKSYCNYKILSLEKNKNFNDYKENAAFIYYIKDINDYNINETNFEMVVEHINEYMPKNKLELYDVIFSNLQKDLSIYDKIVIFCYDDKIKKYYFQDIIDINRLSIYDYKYKIRVNKKIYFFPLKNIMTHLYSFENIIESISKNNNYQIKNLTKYEDIPKYSWNIGFDGNKILLLSEENNNVYSFIEQKLYSASSKPDFMDEKKIEIIKNENHNKIVSFLESTKIGSSFILDDKENIFILDEKKTKYKWLNIIEREKIEHPICIPNLKIMNISCNYDECYIIGKDGCLYKIFEQNINKIETPQNTKKFLQCACGEGYLICLIQNNKGNGTIYAIGNNYNFQCGISYKDTYNNYMGENIKTLTKCPIDDDLDFKYICTYQGFSAAITYCGKLYVWGIYNNILIDNPTLVNQNRDEIILFDKIALNYNNLYAIGRKLENGNYITKLFFIKIYKNYKIDIIDKIEIENKEENNSRIIPIKILIREKRIYYLCINENKLIEEIIKNNKEKETKNKFNISISYNEVKTNKDKNKLETLQKIYNSKELIKFIDLFNSFSDTNLKNLVKAFDDIRKKEIKSNDISYDEFISYLKDKNDLKELFLFFFNSEKKEGKALFNYLKIRLSLIEENMMNYIKLDNALKSEGIIQNIIKKNFKYLNDDMRIQYFYSLLLNKIDENYRYKRPREYQITIDRFKANKFKEKSNESRMPDIQLNETIFGQLFNIFKDVGGKEFLREKGQNLFKVELKNERAIDAGGPYREILSDMCNDLLSDYLELFIKTPNNSNDIGELRDKYIINPNCNNINHKKAFEFIGKMMILAISSGETLNLNLHPIVWKSMLEKEISFKEYETIDLNFYNLINKLEEALSKKDKDLINILDLNFVIKNSNGKDVELINNGQEIKVTLDNLQKYIELAKSMRIGEINNQINFILNGVHSGIEKNILQILDWKQLEEMVCGKEIFNIEDFKKITKCDDKEEVIQWFWEWLKICKEEDKFEYLKFVSGRSRFPKSGLKHTIRVMDNQNKLQLPIAHTCSSELDLPKYESKEILFEKMKYAIDNITNITDN